MALPLLPSTLPPGVPVRPFGAPSPPLARAALHGAGRPAGLVAHPPLRLLPSRWRRHAPRLRLAQTRTHPRALSPALLTRELRVRHRRGGGARSHPILLCSRRALVPRCWLAEVARLLRAGCPVGDPGRSRLRSSFRPPNYIVRPGSPGAITSPVRSVLLQSRQLRSSHTPPQTHHPLPPSTAPLHTN